MRRLVLLPFLALACSSTPNADTAPPVQSVYDQDGNLKANLATTRSWEEQQELMNSMRDSLKKNAPADASGPTQEPAKKK